MPGRARGVHAPSTARAESRNSSRARRTSSARHRRRAPCGQRLLVQAGQVDAVHGEVLAHVAQEVRQLEGDAEARDVLAALGRHADQRRHHAPDRRGAAVHVACRARHGCGAARGRRSRRASSPCRRRARPAGAGGGGRRRPARRSADGRCRPRRRPRPAWPARRPAPPGAPRGSRGGPGRRRARPRRAGSRTRRGRPGARHDPAPGSPGGRSDHDAAAAPHIGCRRLECPCLACSLLRVATYNPEGQMTAIDDAKLVVVTGKGGTGRTTVAPPSGSPRRRADGARSSARSAASRAWPRCSARVRTPPRPGVETPRDGLGRPRSTPTARWRSGSRTSSRAASSQPLARSGVFAGFVAAAPGARELVTITKAWELGQTRRWRRARALRHRDPRRARLRPRPRAAAHAADVRRHRPRRADRRPGARGRRGAGRSGAQPPGRRRPAQRAGRRARRSSWRGAWPPPWAAVSTRSSSTASGRDACGPRRRGGRGGRRRRRSRRAPGRHAPPPAASATQQAQLARLRRDAVAAVSTLPFVFGERLGAEEIRALSSRLAAVALGQTSVRGQTALQPARTRADTREATQQANTTHGRVGPELERRFWRERGAGIIGTAKDRESTFRHIYASHRRGHPRCGPERRRLLGSVAVSARLTACLEYAVSV